MPKLISSSLRSLLILLPLTAATQTRFNPTTTLAAEIANNTSASDVFVAQKNGNIAAGNVSKVPIRTLLYPGSTAKLYAHLVQWFGYGDHVEVGYRSGDALQVQKQVTDMVSRGLDGAIIDWYGRGASRKTFSFYDEGTQLLMREAEQHPGFAFAVMLDIGANRDCERQHGCDVTENLVEDLNYAHRSYEDSPAYLHQNGRPVVFFFGHEGHGIDWSRVRSRVAGDPIFVFRNSGAFRHDGAQGGFAWVSPSQATEKDPTALDYLVNYYETALRHPDSYSLGTAYKGFDDSIALWGSRRLIDQKCGQTWLRSIDEANKFYSSQTQMLGIQLVTWNDYEEGTEFESGIDNCVTISAWVRGTSAFWKIRGDHSTIDHYTVFVSRDGENLMPLANVLADTTTLDLGRFSLEPAEYTIYVKAVAKPSLTNKISEGRRIRISGGAAGPQAALSVVRSAGTTPGLVTASVSSLNGMLSPTETTIDFGDGTVVTGESSAQHTYGLAGVYTVMVTITDLAGRSSTQTAAITVESP